MISAFIDEYPKYLKNRKMLFTVGVCVVEFLLGIPCIMEGGIYVLQILDWYCAVFSLMLLSLTECIVIGWIYGADRFLKDIEFMIGYMPSVWWKICWKFVTPLVIIFIWLFSVTHLKPVSYGDYQYPQWAIVIGWLVGLASIVPLPLYMIYSIMQTQGNFIHRVKTLVQPDPRWGPAVERYRLKYQASKSSMCDEIEPAGIYYRANITADTKCQPEVENLVY